MPISACSSWNTSRRRRWRRNGSSFFMFAVQRDVRQSMARDALASLMHENGIRTLEAQGTVTKKLYPSPELRMMSDIDFIIDRENLEKAMALVQAAGHETYQHQPEEFNAILSDGLLAEFHTDYFTEIILFRRELFAEALSDPFAHSRPIDGEPLGFVPEDTYYYLYTILHTIKHFETAGCGLRRVLDLYYLKKAFAGKVDEALVKRISAQYGFQESYDVLMALEGLWFEDNPTERDLTQAIETVIEGGNHGTKEIFVRNSVKKDLAEHVRFARLRRVWGIIFPSKQYIYINYPQCAERGYSTLHCQLYRLADKLKHARLGAALRYIKNVLAK